MIDQVFCHGYLDSIASAVSLIASTIHAYECNKDCGSPVVAFAVDARNDAIGDLGLRAVDKLYTNDSA